MGQEQLLWLVGTDKRFVFLLLGYNVPMMAIKKGWLLQNCIKDFP